MRTIQTVGDDMPYCSVNIHFTSEFVISVLEFSQYEVIPQARFYTKKDQNVH